MNRAQHQMMQIIQKIPVFDGLSLEQAQRLIQISKFRQYEAGDTIYDAGEVGDEMLVLIKGKLNVLSVTGQPLGEILPGKSIGEMGLFTGHVRSATIVATVACAGLTMTRGLLTETMNADRDMKGVILENVVTELSLRLADANTRLDVLSRNQQTEPEPDPEEAVSEDATEAGVAEEIIAEAAEDTTEIDDDDDEMPEAEELV